MFEDGGKLRGGTNLSLQLFAIEVSFYYSIKATDTDKKVNLLICSIPDFPIANDMSSEKMRTLLHFFKYFCNIFSD